MVSQGKEQYRSLVDRRASTDLLSDEPGHSYHTFSDDQQDTTPSRNVSGSKESEANEQEVTWTAIIMFASTWLGVFLASVDMSVMSTLSGDITESFSSFHLLTWFINAYTLTSALVQPVSGKLSDIFGRRDCLLLANFAFLLGNLICGLATESWHFILGRAIAGLGGGCLNSISTFVASDVIPLRSRGFWQGIGNIAFGVGFALGGTIGGLISDSFGWRWAFLFQPAPMVFSMLLVWWLIPRSTTGQNLKPVSIKRIDFLGTFILSLATFALMFGTVSGGNTLPWSSPFVCLPLIATPFLLLAFGYVEDKIAKEPIIPVRLLGQRTILGSLLTNLLSVSSNTAVLYYLPITMEIQGLSPASAGLRQIPNAMGTFLGSLAAGVVMNWTGKYYTICLLGHGLLVASSLTLLLTLQNVLGWLSYVMLFLNGFGIGIMVVITLIALISAADHKQHALLTSAQYTCRTAGNTLGTTIAGAIFQNIFGKQLWTRLGHTQGAPELIPAIRRRQVDLNELPKSWRHDIFASYDISLHAVFVFIFASYVLSTLAVSIIRENRLSKTIDRK